MKVTVYGIKNCDKVRQALAWFAKQGIEYRLHDYKSAGVDKKRLSSWCQQYGWEQILNRRSTTWRALAADSKEDLSIHSAVALMQEHPTLIKRPIVEWGKKITIGFSENEFSALMGKS